MVGTPARQFLVFMFTLVLLGCGGAGGQDPQATRTGPTALTVSIYKAPASFRLAWLPPDTPTTGLEIQVRVGTAPYATIYSGPGPTSESVAFYDAGADAPEITTFAFRMRALNYDHASDYSNEATARTGLLPPTLGPFSHPANAIGISWQNNSLVADTLKLERGNQVGADTVWTPIPGVPFGATFWADRDAPEGSLSRYRVTYSKGQDFAQDASYDGAYMLMQSPEQVRITPLLEGARITWLNPSKIASTVAILRVSGFDAGLGALETEVASLPPGTTSYDDTHLTTGYYTYRLENRKPGVNPASSPSVPMATLLPGFGSTVVSSTVVLPSARVVRRSSQGAWYLSGAPGNMEIQVNTPIGNSWTSFTPANAQFWNTPYFLLDSLDQPHLVYSHQVAPGVQDTINEHAWKASSGWQTEGMPQSIVGSPTFSLDAQNHLHLAWQKGPQVQDLMYAVRQSDGSYLVDDLSGLNDSTVLYGFQLVVDPTGQPHILARTPVNLLHLTRANGIWTAETITSGRNYGSMAGFAPAPDAFRAFVSRDYSPDSGTTELVMFQKEAGSWLPEKVLATTTFPDAFTISSLAATGSGQRFALAYSATSTGNMLSVWSWGTQLSVPLGYFDSIQGPLLGFDPSDRLYLLLPQMYGAPDGLSRLWVLYQEQP